MMKLINKIKLLGLSLLFIAVSCDQKEENNENKAEKSIAEVRQEFAPDKRVALFDIQAEKKEDIYVLKGESNLPEAVNNLKKKLEAENVNFRDSIKILPQEEMENMKHGVIKISVANLRGEAAHSSELVTQATLGTPVKVYKKEDNWYLIQTPDNYLSWVDGGGVQIFSDAEFKDWKSSEKLIYLQPFGNSYAEADETSGVVSDLVAGAIFELSGEKNGYFQVKYPDGRTAYIQQNEAKKYMDWLENLDPEGEDLIATSKKLMGLPYLWGGTSAKGVDCSGYTKTVFFLNGMVIPRDASQQVHTGKLIDSTRNFEKLIPGDLLFFGRPATDSTSERVVHVGMWIGNNEFIHSSGSVHVSSVAKEAPNYDDFNYNRYLRTKRLLDEEGEGLTYLRKKDIFTNSSSNEE
ncbi:SH3 domain-containing C40 family peptidase [Salegentibacter sp. F188]|uniref:SH3 domain-containing C40 family peptidase n=1 Tax=Autumnicola patrickiae TaxID=3075591 RepID=A0ABU3E387_9FLAO|nr:SH3 domain-containing C40 family peptidase [Salegentibacter sp. F188]MDT0690436.1 SH3 domain-containing C40 family peptidase [Salegentibacter sp. F188]